MGLNPLLRGPLNPETLVDALRYKRDFQRQHPTYFQPSGLMVFCGPQGSGKTLSAVAYCKRVLAKYPKALFCTNVEINDLPESVRVVPYVGLPSLSDLQNGYEGVLYLIDEIHLEWNSLESKSISIEEMTEFAQQRKQRKHIVGTSQVFMRLAKPLREQIKTVVLCQNFFNVIQHNIVFDGSMAYEEGGRLHVESSSSYWWVHSKELYQCYDTYAKMHRYKEIWGKRRSAPAGLVYDRRPDGC